MPSLESLPTLNATLNGVAAGFLVVGWMLIRRGLMRQHRAAMLAALTCSAAFLQEPRVLASSPRRCRWC
jgi:uncharacterized membrane protein YozB (DUF420 family)